MLYFSTPYAFDEKLLNAYDNEFQRLPNDDDWLAIMDGDVAFLRSDFGLHIQKYIDKYPNTGMFTCYASRSHYQWMMPRDGNDKSADILFHKRIADKHANELTLDVKEISKNVTGHLMVIKKATWLKIREFVFTRGKNELIEAIDTAVTKGVQGAGMKVLLMRGIYVLHYCRMAEGYAYRGHLGYKNFINIITPCSRPENLKAMSESINIPKVAYRWIVVIDGAAGKFNVTLPRNAEVYYHRDPRSISGNAQRNYALGRIEPFEKPRGFNSYVYFLDDDTLMHPDLYKAVRQLDNDFIHFDQENPDGSRRIGGTVKVNHVDSGNVLIRRSLIGDIRWRSDLYHADGVFIERCFQKAKSPLYLPKSLSVYNALRPK